MYDSYDARVVQTVRKLKNESRVESEKQSFSSDSYDSEKNNMRLSEIMSKNIDDRRSHKMNTVKETVRVSTIHAKPKKLSTINNFKHKQSFEYMGYKTKSEFQKRLMNENNIVKYKTTCVSLIKEDEELKKLSDIINIFSLDKFVEVNLFSDSVFLYKLENLLSSDPIKSKREKFFKDEIKKILESINLNIEYETKMNKLNISLENYIQNINKFNFL